MSQDLPPTAAYYDKLSREYDALATPDYWRAPAMVARALQRHTPSPGQPVYIVAIGTGLDVGTILALNPGSIDAIDLSGEMVAISRAKYPQLSITQGDFMAAPPTHDNYGLVVCGGALEFIADFAGFFQKCAGMLQPGGQLVVTYEPIIDGHKLQGEAISQSGHKFEIEDFLTYRHTLTELLAVTAAAALTLLDLTEATAYAKDGCDIIYHCATLRKA